MGDFQMTDNNTTTKQRLGIVALSLALIGSVMAGGAMAHDLNVTVYEGTTSTTYDSNVTAIDIGDSVESLNDVTANVTNIDSGPSTGDLEVFVRSQGDSNTSNWAHVGSIYQTGETTLDASSIDLSQFENAQVVFEVNNDGTTYDVDHLLVTGTATNSDPTADAGGPYEGTAGETIQMDASNSSDGDADNLTYSWSSSSASGGSGGDDTSPTGTSLTFDSAGTYNVSLTVTDEHGATDTATTTVTVQSPPTVSTTTEPDKFSVDFAVTGENGTAVENATVSVGNQSAETDSDGVASISNVTEGNHTVSVDHASYTAVNETVSVDSNLSVDADLGEGNITVSEQDDGGLGGGGGTTDGGDIVIVIVAGGAFLILALLGVAVME